MMGPLLVRGMLVGLLAGVLAFGFAKTFGEPQVDRAIAFETHEHQLAGDPPEPELVSRAVQSTIGLLTGVTVYGAALGGLFSLAFAAAYGRIGRIGPRGTAALVAGLGFVALILIPQIKYPANPPSIGSPDTIGLRTALYFSMILVSVLACATAVVTGRSLTKRWGGWNAALAGGAGYLVVMTAAMLLLPAVNEVPAAFSAVVLWRFRMASLGIEVVFWTTLALVFGAVAERAGIGVRRGFALPRA